MQRRRSRNKIATYFPDEGPFRRELYPKHLEFFAAGKEHRERAFIAANRCGKSDAGAYELTTHLSGDYPHWWTGKRFERPIKAWAASNTNKDVRDVLQEKLLGKWGHHGTGFIPGDLLRKVTSKQGIAETVDTIYVRHVSGGTSSVTLKSYGEGRESFQGGTLEVVWMDEECPMDIWVESVLRTMTTGGCLYLTFTPLLGLSALVLEFMPGGKMPEAA